MIIFKENNIMSKKSIYIPIKIVPYIFVSIAAITIAATTNIIISILTETAREHPVETWLIHTNLIHTNR